jgi:hypothetical protein
MGPETAPESGEISVLTLVDEMARLDHLARLPHAGFTAQQQSSSDRRSRTPADSDGWFANDDFVTNTKPNLVRVEAGPGGDKRYVLLDASGPGAIVRMWTATPTGTLRIFIDDDVNPAVEAPMDKLLSGQIAPFTPPFGQVTAMGYSLYFPFPYKKHCVVTVDSIVSIDPFSGQPVDKLYFQIGTRRYHADALASSGAKFRAFSHAEVDRAQPTIARVGEELRHPAGDFGAIASGAVLDERHPFKKVIRAPSGGGVLTDFVLNTAERDPVVLRTTVLSISFDGEETVRAPLVDFFGTGPGWNPYAALPLSVGPDGSLHCRFPMPFRREAVIKVERATPGESVFGADFTVRPQPFDRDTLMFHARWHPIEVIRTRPFRDWHIATLTGNGRLVGAVLNVDNTANPKWWGEGDEKIFVDGETFPSIFGTGTEDYFGYAWSSIERFAHPYHAQTLATGPGFAGRFSMNRFHVLDPIPFARTLRFDFEVWHWNETSVAMDAMLYWYARPEATDDFPRDAR